MKELTHTLTGYTAAAAKILEEVTAIFHKNVDKYTQDNWRLEYYIMEAMCSPSCLAYVVQKDKIIRIVDACENDYAANFNPARINTAFRKLAHRGFLRGMTETFYKGGLSYRARCYELRLDRYDTDEVEA